MKTNRKKYIFYPCFVSCPFSVSYINHPKAESTSISIPSEYCRHIIGLYIYKTLQSYIHIEIDRYIHKVHISYLPYLCERSIPGYVHFRLRIWGNEGVYVLCLIRSLWDFTLTFVSMTLKISITKHTDLRQAEICWIFSECFWWIPHFEI